jgi:hypothetical protein
VLAVEVDSDDVALWTFDTQISSVSEFGLTGLRVVAQESIDAELNTAYTLLVEYSTPVVVSGAAWTAGPTTTGITFVGGLSLSPSTGVIL